jgi:hypothetical protein
MVTLLKHLLLRLRRISKAFEVAMTMKTRFSQTLRTWQTDLPRARFGAQKRDVSRLKTVTFDTFTRFFDTFCPV